MKKIALAAVALLLLISMVGCGTFSYNIKSYVKVADYNNGDVVFVDKDKLDKAVKEAVDNLIDSYPEIKDKTEGTVAKDDTVYIYYEGTLILFEGETTIKVDSDEVKAVVGFNEALKKAEFKDGKASFELTHNFIYIV
jgi:FKBP-type peptidyl-prolyl cis-trans isomerase (trigger factor)